MPDDTARTSPGTARELATAIHELAREFLRTLDPGAPTEVSTVRLELSGPSLTLTYSQTGDTPPMLHVQMSGITNAPPLAAHDPVAQERGRGVFGRG